MLRGRAKNRGLRVFCVRLRGFLRDLVKNFSALSSFERFSRNFKSWKLFRWFVYEPVRKALRVATFFWFDFALTDAGIILTQMLASDEVCVRVFVT
ncbi:hypothetical protein SUGI_0543430 [Cryptomeria japonica]|nr:hypothetical protein SUGI_0543430 [Cryptomeria japonica]